MLNRSSAQFGANGCQYRIPLDAIFPVNAYLDKFVSLKRVVDFLEHRRGQPVAGNADHGMKMMGLRAIDLTIAGVKAPLAERPNSTSAPSAASASVRALVLAA